MAFRLFPVLLVIFLAFLYIAFFNPGNLTFAYAPGKVVSTPIIAVVAVSFLAGALCLALLYLAQGFGGVIVSMGHSYGRWMDSRMEGNLKKAQEFAQSGEREKALNSLEKILFKKPDHFDALLLKGTLLREAGETKKAMATHSFAISQRPADRNAIMELKDDYVRAGYLSSAYKLLEQIRGRYSGDTQVLVEMRNISERLKDFKLSILLQKEVLRLAKDENDIGKGRYKLSVLYCRHARGLIKAGDIKKSRKELSYAQKLDSAFLPAQIMQSEAALKLGKTGQAESILREIFIKTSSVIPLRMMENMFRAGGKTIEVEGLYDWAASTRPQKKILLLFLAMARIEKSDYNGAAHAMDGAADELGGFAIFNLMRGLVQLNGIHGDGNGDALEAAGQSIRSALDGQWSQFVNYFCNACNSRHAEYFTECPNCREWNTAKAVFADSDSASKQRLLKA